VNLHGGGLAREEWRALSWGLRCQLGGAQRRSNHSSAGSVGPWVLASHHPKVTVITLSSFGHSAFIHAESRGGAELAGQQLLHPSADIQMG
jgi:hypothetical protein